MGRSWNWGRLLGAAAILALVPTLAQAYSFLQTPSGVSLNWATAPIPYYVGPLSSDLPEEAQVNAIQSAAQTWADALDVEVLFEYRGRTDVAESSNDDLNVIFFQQSGWDPSSAAIATTHSYAVESGLMKGFDIPINDANYTFSTSEVPEEIQTDLENSMVHEFGHVLGLGHSNDPDATMYASTQVGDLLKRDLAEDDMMGIWALYPEGIAFMAEGTMYGCACVDDGTGLDQAGSVGAVLLGAFAIIGLRLRRRRRS